MNTNQIWTKKDLVGLENLSLDEMEIIYSLAAEFKATMKRSIKKLPALKGRTVVNLFLEPSTRTRLAFEIAAKRLSADVITVSSSASSLTKGESLHDTAKNIQALNADIIVMRHSSSGAAQYLSKLIDIPVVNAGDGAHAHPTQGLLDTFTMREKFGKNLSGLKVTIVGDILFSRVARSDIYALTKQGAFVTLAGPATLVPKEFEQMHPNVSVCYDVEEAIKNADVIMLLRIQHERQNSSHFPSIGEYRSVYGLNMQRAHLIKKGAIIMHPGPINRDVELDSQLADSSSSVILDQVTNGVAVRMACLYLCSSAVNNKNLQL